MFISFPYGPARDGSFKACFRSALASYHSAANESQLVEVLGVETFSAGALFIGATAVCELLVSTWRADSALALMVDRIKSLLFINTFLIF